MFSFRLPSRETNTDHGGSRSTRLSFVGEMIAKKMDFYVYYHDFTKILRVLFLILAKKAVENCSFQKKTASYIYQLQVLGY